jgi:hypothetical protein
LFRYGLIRKIQDRKPAPAVRINASIMLARSRPAAPDRVRLSSPSSSIGKQAPMKMTSASDGKAVWWSTSLNTTAVMPPVANANVPPATSSHGNLRRGRFFRTPRQIAAVLLSTIATDAGRPTAGKSR